jgi:hypothetical protein
MRSPRYKALRVFALVAMLLSMTGALGLSASAAPVNTGGERVGSFQVASLTLDLCLALDANGNNNGDVSATDVALGTEILAAAGIVIPEAQRGAAATRCDQLFAADTDGDTVTDGVDNCVAVPNPGQEDADGNGIGDACDVVVPVDTDADGVADDVDNCPDVANPGQEDTDGDGVGDACQVVEPVDTDADGVTDDVDNCPDVANPGQEDADGNGIGDACEVVVPPAGDLTVEICTTLDVNGDLTVDEAEGAALAVDLNADGVIDAADVAIAVGGCDELLAPVAPTTGFVDVFKIYCPGITETVFNGAVGEDCTPGAGTFTFYLVGDGTADYWQLNVWEDGFGFIELAPGTYEVVEEGTLATTTITVVAGETLTLTVANPGEAPAPRDGTVNASAFSCTNISETIFTSDGFAVMAGLPTFEPACEPTPATLTFYLVGDATADFWQLELNSAGSIVLPPGTYEVVEESTQASTFITVFAGDFINLDVQIPAGGEVVPGSSVNIAKFYCDTVTETEFLSLTASEYSERDELFGAPDCVAGYATFTFYLVGDGTADYAQIGVNGSGTIGLDAGIYEVVEEETQATFTLEVFDGENTMLIVNNPMPEDGEVPGAPDDGGDDADDDGKDADKDEDGEEVTKLPSTGSGVSDGTAMLTIAAAAAAAISGAGAISLRNKR